MLHMMEQLIAVPSYMCVNGVNEDMGCIGVLVESDGFVESRAGGGYEQKPCRSVNALRLRRQNVMGVFLEPGVFALRFEFIEIILHS